MAGGGRREGAHPAGGSLSPRGAWWLLSQLAQPLGQAGNPTRFLRQDPPSCWVPDKPRFLWEDSVSLSLHLQCGGAGGPGGASLGRPPHIPAASRAGARLFKAILKTQMPALCWRPRSCDDGNETPVGVAATAHAPEPGQAGPCSDPTGRHGALRGIWSTPCRGGRESSLEGEMGLGFHASHSQAVQPTWMPPPASPPPTLSSAGSQRGS